MGQDLSIIYDLHHATHLTHLRRHRGIVVNVGGRVGVVYSIPSIIYNFKQLLVPMIGPDLHKDCLVTGTPFVVRQEELVGGNVGDRLHQAPPHYYLGNVKGQLVDGDDGAEGAGDEHYKNKVKKVH